MVSSKVPWFTNELRDLKRKRRKTGESNEEIWPKKLTSKPFDQFVINILPFLSLLGCSKLSNHVPMGALDLLPLSMLTLSVWRMILESFSSGKIKLIMENSNSICI